MKIEIAESAGFCFGVNRAVRLVYQLLDEGKKVCTLGPIIHNPQMVKSLAQRGVVIAENISDIPQGFTVVIRSHGITKETESLLRKKNIPYVDATCPFVAKIHQLVKEATEAGKFVLIAGDSSHPEVMGFRSYCPGNSYVFSSAEDLESFIKKREDLHNFPLIVVAQTTFNTKEWKNCLKIMKRVYTNATIFDTICNATFVRQQEAIALSKRSDVMIVVGGKQSSNTGKLREVCAEHSRAFLIETASELPMEEIKKAKSIGLTAGASTPADIIKEVLETMSEILNNSELNSVEENNGANEVSFEAMLEESLKTVNTDEKVHGVVVGIAPNEVYVDVGRKQAGFIPLAELSNDPSAKPEDLVKIGDEMDLLIMRTNDQEGTIMLSKKRYDAIQGWEAIVQAAEDKTILSGVVTEVIKGGVIVVSNGVRVFIPASQATASRGDSLDALLKKEVEFRIIEANVNRGRRRAVGSIRSVLNDKKKELEDKFWESAEEGKTYTGVVKSLTSYGAFVDIGGVDGMIHISELSWNHIKNPSEVLNVGDTVEVYILKLDPEKRKISLGYKKAEDNPWEILKNQYPAGTVADVQIVGLTDFGAFARIIPGVDGLIHISQISNERINKPQDVLSVGQEVKAKITAIDFDKKRVSLSMKELLDDNASVEEDSSEEQE